MTDKKISGIYLKDIAAIVENISELDGKAEWLWVTGEIFVTDGETRYTLVHEDDSWYLDPSRTKPEDDN